MRITKYSQQGEKFGVATKKSMDIRQNIIYLSKSDKDLLKNKMKKSFGELIRKLRTEKKLTLTQLAAQLNMDPANLSKIETGKRDFDEKRLEKLAKVFNLDLEELKIEYFSDYIAKKLYKIHNSKDTLILAEEKANYLRIKMVKQTN